MPVSSRLLRGALAFAVACTLALSSGCKKEDPPGERAAPAPNSALAKEVASLKPGEEREVDDGVYMTMNRTSATDPIGDGWHRAESKDGGFSVQLPLAYNDFRIRSVGTDGVELRSHSLGGKTPGLLAWTATCVVRRDGSFGPGGRSPEPDKTEAKGSPVAAYQRTVQLEGQTCILIVEAQGKDPLPSEVDRQRFLSSFKVTRAPAW